MKPWEDVPGLQDDGLVTPSAGDWGERKYRLVELYATIFVNAMREKWDSLVYIDLFAGAGRARMSGSAKIIPGSPMVVLGLDRSFDRHIFCDSDPERMAALRQRVGRDFAGARCSFLQGDTNGLVDQILEEMPRHSRSHRVLGFCFSDPYGLLGLHFETIRRLSERFMDHLILIPTGMDANRNMATYLNPENPALDDFLGGTGWRSRWPDAERQGTSVGVFLIEEFARAMEGLRYHLTNPEDTVAVRSLDKNLPLYHLAHFSRHKLGAAFWREARKYSTGQTELF